MKQHSDSLRRFNTFDNPPGSGANAVLPIPSHADFHESFIDFDSVEDYPSLAGRIDVPFTSIREVTATGTLNIAGNGGVLASDTTPTLNYVNGDTDSSYQLVWAAANVDPIHFEVDIPSDLDTTRDIVVNIVGVMGGATDTPVVALDSYFDTGDTKVEDDTSAFGTPSATKTATIAAADIPTTAQKLTVEATPGAHGTDTLTVTAIFITYTKVHDRWKAGLETNQGTIAIRTDQRLGVLRFTNGAVDNDATSLQEDQEVYALTANKTMAFVFRVQVSEATQSDFFIGLSIRDTALGGATLPQASDYIGFVKDDGDDNLDFVAGKNSTETQVADIHTVVAATDMTLAIVIDGTAKAQAFVDGVPKGAVIETNLPDDENLVLSYIVQNGDANARTMDIDFRRAIQER